MNLLGKKPYIIADVGSNWKRSDSQEKDLALALRHIREAAQCGVSAVKFQFFTHRELYGVDGPCPYALPQAFLSKLQDTAQACGVDFLCTAFSPEGIDVVDEYVVAHKIASSEMNHVLMLKKAVDKAKPVIVSTGGATQAELKALYKFIKATPNVPFAVLECVASYPADPTDYNITSLHKGPGSYFGVSDHTLGIEVALTAVGFGATVFEKHFDAVKDDPAYASNTSVDTDTSVTTSELAHYCAAIRTAVGAMGTGVKTVRESEKDMSAKHKRRLKTMKNLKPGDVLFIGDNFGIYRSLFEDEKAEAPENWKFYEGKRVVRAMRASEGLCREDIEAAS